MTLQRDRLMSALGRAAMAMIVFAVLVWRFESPPFAPHLVEVAIMGAVTAVSAGLFGEIPTQQSAGRLMRLLGFWLVLLLIPIAAIYFLR